MNEHHLLMNIVLLLTVAAVAVAMSKRLHFPPIIAYIVVGLIVGPSGFAWIQKEENIELLAEFGIVFLLFAIGLEFSVSQMLAMRKQVFGLGAIQVSVTALIIFIIAQVFGLDNNTSVIIAGAFALSSTAIVIKQLTEQSEIQSRHGRSVLGILIFQDIMAIPLLILIPALALSGNTESTLSWTLLMAFFKGILVLITMHLIGKYLLRPVFHEVASAKSQELFTLTVLTVALGAAAFTEELGLSMTLGAFLAGMMLSETEYRHQIESDIRPFQDILLGLFFVTVGMLISIDILVEHFWTILLITFSIFVVKGAIIFVIGRIFSKSSGVAMRIALSLSQVGEFGLVVITMAFSFKLLPEQTGNILLTAAVINMAIAPFLIKFNGKITKKLLRHSYHANHHEIENNISQDNKNIQNHIILCGFGRVGQTVSRFLHKSNQRFIALDMDIKRVHEARAAGESVYYGDAAKETILNAAALDKSQVVIITFHDFHASMKILRTIRQHNEQVPILVRTLDDKHVNELMSAGATEVVPDTFEASIMLASHLLLMVGEQPSKVLRQTRNARKNRYQTLENYYPGEDDNRLEQHQVMKGIIHSVLLEDNHYAIGKTLKNLALGERFSVKIEAIKRGHVRGENPSEDTLLRLHDHVVVSGLPEDIEKTERFLTLGK